MRCDLMWKWGVLAAVLLQPAWAGAQVLFYTDTFQPSPAIRRCEPNGQGLVSMPLPANTFPEGIAYDGPNDRLYWVEAAYSGARIRRTNGGLGPGTTLISGLGSLRGLAVDGVGGWMYWTSSDQGVATINRARVDGTGHEVLLALTGYNPRQIVIDPGAAKLYWTDFELDALMRCNFDGTVAEYAPLAAGSRPYGIAIDMSRNLLWWSTYAAGELVSAPRPSSPAAATAASVHPVVQDLEARSAVLIAAVHDKRPLVMPSRGAATGLTNITQLAVDEASGRVYFTQATPSLSGGYVRRVESNGSGLTTLLVPENAFGGVAWHDRSLLDVPGGGPEPPLAAAAWTLRAPNPARAGSSIEFSLPSEGDVRLDVMDAAGRRVATLAEGSHAAGVHRVTWTGQTGAGRAAPGVYVLRLEWGGRRLTQRMTFVR